MLLTAFLLQTLPAGSVFTCTPTRVWDGDGPIWYAQGPKIRLAGMPLARLTASAVLATHARAAAASPRATRWSP